MSILARFRRKASAEQLRHQRIDTELTSLKPFYPPRELSMAGALRQYPPVTSLEAHGCGACLLSVHATAKVLAQVERAIEELGFLAPLQTGHFQTRRRGQDAVSLQTEALGDGITLLLVSNSVQLLQAMPDLAPPPPWQVFPEIDADGLGSLQGSLEHWWQSFWWPYWQSLSQAQRKQWLQEPSHPEGWREYLQLQEAFNGNDQEPPA